MAADTAPDPGDHTLGAPVPGTTARQRATYRCVPGAAGTQHGPRLRPRRPATDDRPHARQDTPPLLRHRTARHPTTSRPCARCRGHAASPGERLTPAPPRPGPGATTTPPHARWSPAPPARAHGTTGAARGTARPPSGAAPIVGPGTGWCGDADHGDTGRVVWDDRAWSALALSHARQQRCAQQPNAGHQAPPMAEARDERRLLAVACMP